MKTGKRQKFVLCVRANGSEDLESRKLYEIISDSAAAREGYSRIIDESGEDYLYPAEYFVPIALPSAVVRELRGENQRAAKIQGGARAIRAARR